MTEAETMALAVLRGDLTAARALADHLCQEYARGGEQVVPRRLVTCPPERVRAVFTLPRYQYLAEGHLEGFDDMARRWLAGTSPTLILPQGWKVDVYEFPEPSRG